MSVYWNLVLNRPFIKRNFVLNGNIFRSLDYNNITGNLASAEKYSGPLRFRLRQVLLYLHLQLVCKAETLAIKSDTRVCITFV
jgi:hypothetical protein